MFFHFKYVLKHHRSFVYLRIVMEYYTTIKANKIVKYRDLQGILLYEKARCKYVIYYAEVCI